MPYCNYSGLKEAAKIFCQHGYNLQTVIPLALPAENFPLKHKNSKTNQWEVRRDNKGQPLPAYVGKNPSYWRANCQPRLTSQNEQIDLVEVVRRIGIAEQKSRPIGLSLVTSNNLVVIDFDRKNYPSQEALDQELTALLDLYPELKHTRAERTPGGGYHIFVRVADAMASWRIPGSCMHCNFTTVAGGPHRGEILAGGRVCVCAPTRTSLGSYELINRNNGFNFVEIADLASIGIFPGGAELRAAPLRYQEAITVKRSSSAFSSTSPSLSELIGAKAKALLEGRRPYGNGNHDSKDRSLQLSGFTREVYSWINLLDMHKLPFSGDADQLLQQAITELGIEDKAERVVRGINPGSCHHVNPENALLRYKYVVENRSEPKQHYSNMLNDCNNESTGCLTSDPPSQPMISNNECREPLKEAADADQPASELELMLDEPGESSTLNQGKLRQLLIVVRQEAGQRDLLHRETSTIKQRRIHGDARTTVSLDYLFTPTIAESLLRVTENLPYCDQVVATTFLAGVSSLVRLGTTINGNPYTDFVVPANLYVALVGRSGQKKSALGRLLICNPANELILELKTRNKDIEYEWKEECKSSKSRAERPPKPYLPSLHIQEYTGESLVGQLQENEKHGLGLLVLRDELSGLFQGMNAYRSGKGSDEQQLLELFDGQGYTSIRVSSGSRSYSRSQVSIYGTIQPRVLQQLTKHGDPSGKWARFLFSPLPNITKPLPTVCDESSLANIKHANKTLQSFARKIHEIPPRCYQLEAKAIKAFSDYEHEKQIQSQQAILDSHGAIYGKSAGKVLRVALLLHLSQLAGYGGDVEDAVSETILNMATELVDHLDDWALGFHEQAAPEVGRDIPTLMRRIHKLASRSSHATSWKELRQQMNSTQKNGITTDLAESAMKRLADLGLGKLSKGPRGGLLFRAEGQLPG